jgi:hypothetical protein
VQLLPLSMAEVTMKNGKLEIKLKTLKIKMLKK